MSQYFHFVVFLIIGFWNVASVAKLNCNDELAKLAAVETAERNSPTATINIVTSEDISQYTTLENYVGQKVEVVYVLGEKNSENKLPVEQLVLTENFLDNASKQIVRDLKSTSPNSDGDFVEFGGWLLYTKQGIYSTKRTEFIRGEGTALRNADATGAYSKLVQTAKEIEGSKFELIEAEFYHTHLVDGEALSPGDADYQKKMFRTLSATDLNHGGIFSMYAVPVRGSILFRIAVRRN